METHSPSLPPLHSGDKKNSPVLLSEQFVAGDEQHRLSLHGGHPHSPQHRLFLPLCSACLPRSWFCACHPPPTGRLCARPVGGGPVRRLLYCHCRFVRLCPAAGRFGRATRSFSLLIGNFHRPVSLEDVNTRGFSCKDTFSFSLRSPSLSISSSSLDPCILYYELVLPSMNLECL